MDAYLHPNLARIAAAYDQICERFASGALDALEARRQIEALAARDDNGVIWTIDAVSGDWHYRTLDGRLVPGEPPTSGYATPTAHDVTRNPQGPRPSDRLVVLPVDDTPSVPGSLAGSTRPAAPVPAGSGGSLSVLRVAALIAAAGALLAFALR